MLLFNLVGGRNGYDLVAARVHILDQSPDIAAFSSRIPTLIHDDNRNTSNVHFVFQFPDILLQGFQQGIVFIPFHGFGEIDIIQDGNWRRR